MAAREQAQKEKQRALDAAGVPKETKEKHVKKIVATAQRRREAMRKPQEGEVEEEEGDPMEIAEGAEEAAAKRERKKDRVATAVLEFHEKERKKKKKKAARKS